MRRRDLLLVLPLLSFLWFSAIVIWGGLNYENYDHASQFISELGATGSPVANQVNFVGFIPAELFILTFVVLAFSKIEASRSNRLGLIFIAIYAFTLALASVFPCDYECRPETPTMSHLIHVGSAIPGYLSAIAAIFILSINSPSWLGLNSLRYLGLMSGAIAIFAFFNLDENSQYVGVYQRVLEVTIYIWLIVLGYCLRRTINN